LVRWARACQRTSAGRLVRAENLHLTLAFIGEADERARVLLGQLGAAVRGEAFELELDQVGYWPHNRIVFAAAGVVPPPLGALVQRLSGELAANGFRVDARPFAAHVTLLRDVRRAPGFAPPAALRWRVHELVLLESLRLEAKLVYRPAERWTLAN
jgi:2'-5' RNA ligase